MEGTWCFTFPHCRLVSHFFAAREFCRHMQITAQINALINPEHGSTASKSPGVGRSFESTPQNCYPPCNIGLPFTLVLIFTVVFSFPLKFRSLGNAQSALETAHRDWLLRRALVRPAPSRDFSRANVKLLLITFGRNLVFHVSALSAGFSLLCGKRILWKHCKLQLRSMPR